jgi:hypothetical protein
MAQWVSRLAQHRDRQVLREVLLWATVIEIAERHLARAAGAGSGLAASSSATSGALAGGASEQLARSLAVVADTAFNVADEKTRGLGGSVNYFHIHQP